MIFTSVEWFSLSRDGQAKFVSYFIFGGEIENANI